MANVRERITAIVGTSAAEQVIDILNDEAAHRCRDADCIRLLPHSRLARHLWRHVPVAPLAPGLFGRRCVVCGQPGWTRIHRVARQDGSGDHA